MSDLVENLRADARTYAEGGHIGIAGKMGMAADRIAQLESQLAKERESKQHEIERATRYRENFLRESLITNNEKETALGTIAKYFPEEVGTIVLWMERRILDANERAEQAESELKKVRIALSGYKDSDLASLAETLMQERDAAIADARALAVSISRYKNMSGKRVYAQMLLALDKHGAKYLKDGAK